MKPETVEEVWYFAYDANLDKKNIVKRIGDYKEARRAMLKDYKITFNSFHPGWGGGVADIVEEKGDTVYGVVYRISCEQVKKLDKFMGVPDFYKKIKVKVETDRGEIEAFTYTTAKKRKFVAPTSSYVSHILKGLKQHGWNTNIVESVKRKFEDFVI